jgi:hypothetical protein
MVLATRMFVERDKEISQDYFLMAWPDGTVCIFKHIEREKILVTLNYKIYKKL